MAPFGTVRGANLLQDEFELSHGWLNQVADTDTGLTYLNARYYDQAL